MRLHHPPMSSNSRRAVMTPVHLKTKLEKMIADAKSRVSFSVTRWG